MRAILHPITAALAAVAVLTSAGCSVWSETAAVSVRAENGALVADEWGSSAGCTVQAGARAPCSAQTYRQRHVGIEP